MVFYCYYKTSHNLAKCVFHATLFNFIIFYVLFTLRDIRPRGFVLVYILKPRGTLRHRHWATY